MNKKYLVIGGAVRSKNDGDWHYVGVRELLRLYRVDPSECVCIESDQEDRYLRSMSYENLTILRPRYDGEYNLSVNKKGGSDERRW